MTAHLWRLLLAAPIIALGAGAPGADAVKLNPAAVDFTPPELIK
jgi:hypothetical protein